MERCSELWDVLPFCRSDGMTYLNGWTKASQRDHVKAFELQENEKMFHKSTMCFHDRHFLFHEASSFRGFDKVDKWIVQVLCGYDKSFLWKSVWVHLKCVSKIHTRKEETLESHGKSVWVHLKCVSKIHTRNEETLESLSGFTGFTSSVSPKFILGTKKPWKVCLGSPQVCLQKIHTRNEETLESLCGFTSSVSPKFILGTKKPWKVCLGSLGSPQVCLQNSY